MRMRVKMERAAAHLTEKPESWGGEGDRGSIFRGLETPSGVSPESVVWQQRDHANLHESLEYEQTYLGADIERGQMSLQEREIIAPEREIVVLLETEQLRAAAHKLEQIEERGDDGSQRADEREKTMDEGLHYDHAGGGSDKFEDRVYRPGVWTLKESMVLLEAKKREKEILSGSKRNSVSADEKWRAVAAYCWSRGVQRSKEQCRFKWENTMPDFKKVREYEDEKGDEEKSYFEMESWQRKSNMLPPNLNRDLYLIMDELLVRKLPKQGSSSVKKDARGKKEPAQLDQSLLLEAAVAALPSGDGVPDDTTLRDVNVVRDPLTGIEPSQSENLQRSTLRQRATPEVKGGPRKRRKKTLEARELEVATPSIEQRGATELGTVSTSFREGNGTTADTVRREVRSGEVFISEVPTPGPGVQLVRLEASRETAYKHPYQTGYGTSEAADKSSPGTAQKKPVAAPSPERPDDFMSRTREIGKSEDVLTRLEGKKDARCCISITNPLFPIAFCIVDAVSFSMASHYLRCCHWRRMSSVLIHVAPFVIHCRIWMSQTSRIDST